MSEVIQLADYQTGARFFKPKTTGIVRSSRQSLTTREAPTLRLQAPAITGRVRLADGRSGLVMGKNHDGKVIVSVNGIRQLTDASTLEKAGA